MRKISALMAVPIASKFTNISSITKLTATKKLNTFTREREDQVKWKNRLPKYDSILLLNFYYLT
jgi:hypothetical protein